VAEVVFTLGDPFTALAVTSVDIAEAIFPISCAVAALEITEEIGAPDGARVHQGQRR